eukprot:gnl/MRDRNA2_/MRDRNA2_86279_c0_seq2.p1 gnl/MRDRNA2_/MRDRNA2_86279_c0~~gnl/MRDRNA2_/MRDRNA2_86279_c0_seq2.p1  ORF type:complete len:1127 (+),score=235.79 gnl/MRDRNA2_/MRDRNA2_86279_c0_seq2:86-3382(+)
MSPGHFGKDNPAPSQDHHAQALLDDRPDYSTSQHVSAPMPSQHVSAPMQIDVNSQGLPIQVDVKREELEIGTALADVGSTSHLPGQNGKCYHSSPVKDVTLQYLPNDTHVSICSSTVTPAIGAKCDVTDGQFHCCGKDATRPESLEEVAPDNQHGETAPWIWENGSAENISQQEAAPQNKEAELPSGFTEANLSQEGSTYTTRFTSHLSEGFRTWAAETTREGLKAMSTAEVYVLSESPLLGVAYTAGFKIEDVFGWWAWAYPENHDASLRSSSSSSMLQMEQEEWDNNIEEEADSEISRPSRGEVLVQRYEETLERIKAWKLKWYTSWKERRKERSTKSKQRKEHEKKLYEERKEYEKRRDIKHKECGWETNRQSFFVGKTKEKSCEIAHGEKNMQITGQLTELLDLLNQQTTTVNWVDARYITFPEGLKRWRGNMWKRFTNWVSKCPKTKEEMREMEKAEKDQWKGDKKDEKKDEKEDETPDLAELEDTDEPSKLQKIEKKMDNEASNLNEEANEGGTTAEEDDASTTKQMKAMNSEKSGTTKNDVEEVKKKACKARWKRFFSFIGKILWWLLKIVKMIIVSILRAIGKLFTSMANMIDGIGNSPTPQLSVQGAGVVAFGLLGGVEEVIDFSQRDITYFTYVGAAIGPSSLGVSAGLYNMVAWKGNFMNLTCEEAYSGPFVGGAMGLPIPIPGLSIAALTGVCAVFDGKEFRSIPDTLLAMGLGVGTGLSVKQILGGMSLDVAVSYYKYFGGFCFRDWKHFKYLRYGMKALKLGAGAVSLGMMPIIQWAIFKINKYKVAWKEEVEIQDADLMFDSHNEAPWRCSRGATIIDKYGEREQTKYALATMLYGAQDHARTLEGLLETLAELYKTIESEVTKRLALDEKNGGNPAKIKEDFPKSKKKTSSEYARFMSSKEVRKLRKKLIKALPKNFVDQEGNHYECVESSGKKILRKLTFGRYSKCTKHENLLTYNQSGAPVYSYDNVELLDLLRLLQDWLKNGMLHVAKKRIEMINHCGVMQLYCETYEQCKKELPGLNTAESPMSKHQHWAKMERERVQEKITELKKEEEGLRKIVDGEMTDSDAEKYVLSVSKVAAPR